MFNVGRITEKVYPEAFGVGTYCGAEVGAAAFDKWVQKDKPAEKRFPYTQTGITVVSLIGGALMIGYDRYPEIGTGLFAASGITAFANVVRVLYTKVSKEGGQKGKDTLALIPAATYEGKQVGTSRKGYLGTSSSPLDVTVEEESPEETSLVGARKSSGY